MAALTQSLNQGQSRPKSAYIKPNLKPNADKKRPDIETKYRSSGIRNQNTKNLTQKMLNRRMSDWNSVNSFSSRDLKDKEVRDDHTPERKVNNLVKFQEYKDETPKQYATFSPLKNT